MRKFKKIVLAGGTGQVGSAIAEYFKNICDDIVLLSRDKARSKGNVRHVNWDGKTPGDWSKELNGCDLLVNLTGKNINCRHNAKNKKLILDSRTQSVRALASAVETCATPPKVWIQCSSAAIYRHADYTPKTEDNTDTGSGFMVDVCKAWENTFAEVTASFKHTRLVVLRVSLVLGKDAGVFPRLKNLVKFGLGGKQGNGKQMISWIHQHDLAACVYWIASHEQISGPLNCASPFPLTNKLFMQTMRSAMHIPIGLPTPALMLKAGAVLIGTEASLVLDSMWALPQKLQNSGFEFKYPKLEDAIGALLRD